MSGFKVFFLLIAVGIPWAMRDDKFNIFIIFIIFIMIYTLIIIPPELSTQLELVF